MAARYGAETPVLSFVAILRKEWVAAGQNSSPWCNTSAGPSTEYSSPCSVMSSHAVGEASPIFGRPNHGLTGICIGGRGGKVLFVIVSAKRRACRSVSARTMIGSGLHFPFHIGSARLVGVSFQIRMTVIPPECGAPSIVRGRNRFKFVDSRSDGLSDSRLTHPIDRYPLSPRIRVLKKIL